MENINTFTKNDKLVKALKMLFKNKNISIFIKNYKEFLYPSGLKGFSFEYEIHENVNEESFICKSLYTYDFAKIDPVEDIFVALLEDLNNDNVKWEIKKINCLQ